jgi:type IV secretion system protein VirB8
MAAARQLAVSVAMNDIASDPQTFAATVQAFRAELSKPADRERRQWRRIAVGLTVAVAVLAGAVFAMIPLQRQIIVPIVMHSDGSSEVAWSWRDVLASDKAAIITGALWYYIVCREGYNWHDGRKYYDTVSAMSAQNVRDDYQKWFLYAKDSSPQFTIGRHGDITIQPDGDELSNDAPVARFYFWRIEHIDGEVPRKTRWTATIDYRVNVPVPGPTHLFDPEGIVVVSYSAQQDSPK